MTEGRFEFSSDIVDLNEFKAITLNFELKQIGQIQELKTNVAFIVLRVKIQYTLDTGRNLGRLICHQE